jgi:HSP90 family molecular chaperone
MDIGWVCVDLFLNEFEETFFDRSGSYEIETLIDDVDRGTSIRCYLRDDCAEFSKEETIKRKKYLTNIQSLMFFFYLIEVVKKYSNFVSAPIYINDVRVNNLRVC